MHNIVAAQLCLLTELSVDYIHPDVYKQGIVPCMGTAFIMP